MQDEREETRECDWSEPDYEWSEPDYEPIEPEPSYFWTSILRPVLLVSTVLCLAFFVACFVATQGKFGVKDAEKLSDTEINLWPRAGEETKVEIYSTFERTLWGKKERLVARVPISTVRYEVDSSVEEVAVSVVPTFWSRLSDPIIYFDGSEATIYVPNEEEVLLVKEFLEQDKASSYAGFRWLKDKEKELEETNSEFYSSVGEKMFQTAKKEGFSSDRVCELVLQAGIALRVHERTHGRSFDPLLLFGKLGTECSAVILAELPKGL